MSSAYRWIHRVWYEQAPSGVILLPLSGLYWLLLKLRILLYRTGLAKSLAAEVPVIVVGNITAGGTGKTPTVVWLVSALREQGFSPGVVSRGYGGSKSDSSMRVDGDSDTEIVGDEPVLLARRAGCPVVVDADRVRGAAMLVEDGVDVVVADDGLQHLRLQRDFEICVIDGERGLGNGWLLPAGPLRESARKLREVDVVLQNGVNRETDFPGATVFELRATAVQRLNGSGSRQLSEFKDKTVHAVAGIGNPGRFFELLRQAGLQVIEHSFPDHARLEAADLQFGDDFDVFMTEKDAVKLGRNFSDQYSFVPVDLIMDADRASALITGITTRLKAARTNT